MTREDVIEKAADIINELDFDIFHDKYIFNGVIQLASELLDEPYSDLELEILERSETI